MGAGKGTQTNRFFSGFLSGWTAATMALPFDFVKTRLQQMEPCPTTGKLPYTGIANCFKTVFVEGGPLAFYSGYPTFITRITPHIMLTWVFLDFLNDIDFLKP